MVTRVVRMDIVMLQRQGLSKRQIAKQLGIRVGREILDTLIIDELL